MYKYILGPFSVIFSILKLNEVYGSSHFCYQKNNNLPYVLISFFPPSDVILRFHRSLLLGILLPKEERKREKKRGDA